MTRSFPYPYMVIVSDGKSFRTLKPAQLGAVGPQLDAVLCDLLLAPPPPTPVVVPKDPANADMMSQSEIARSHGYTGDACDNCGQFKMKQSGHCTVCDACGTTTGCS